MRTFALTYPQLMNQAVEINLDERDLARLDDGHGLATRLVDGIYRKQGAPFLCHLVRTASIVMAETRSMDVILAAMLHAVYFLHYFENSGRRGPRKSDRIFLRNRIGDHAEALISEYAGFAWNRTAVIRDYADNTSGHDRKTREMLLLKLANELEDHLDASTAYATASEREPRYLRFGDDYIRLAESLGHPALASDLREAFDLCGRMRVPAALRSGRRGSYELRSRLWKANIVERLGAKLRRVRAARDK